MPNLNQMAKSGECYKDLIGMYCIVNREADLQGESQKIKYFGISDPFPLVKQKMVGHAQSSIFLELVTEDAKRRK